METLKLKEEDIKNQIGSGCEGYVKSYKDIYAVKIFHKFQWTFGGRTLDMLDRKMEKVEAMMSLEDPSAAFPLGFAEVPNEDDVAYYMKRVTSHIFYPPYLDARNLSDLWYEEYDDRVEGIMLKADAALQRIHKLGVAIGDIKETNILLQDDIEPIYVDLDNAVYQDYPFDTYPQRADIFNKIYGGGKTSYQDNDKLVFALMALHMKTRDNRMCNPENKESIARAINGLSPDKITKEVLDCIFSDAENKPYIGTVLNRIRKRRY